MAQSIRRWLLACHHALCSMYVERDGVRPFALCCAPGGVAALLVVGMAFGGAAGGLSLDSPPGIGLLAAAILACPISMVLMMRGMRRAPASSDAMSCCAPQVETNPPTRSLADLRVARAELERKIAALQQQT